jgi:hypothetical protein
VHQHAPAEREQLPGGFEADAIGGAGDEDGVHARRGA